jgi:uncharacterized membrane protein
MKLKLQAFFAKKENLYLVLALTFGLMMAIFNPPFDGVPDEHAHYWKAWAVAEGNFLCHADDQIPKSAINLPGSNLKVSVPGDDKKIVFNGFLVKLFEKDSGEMSAGGSAICGATPLGYIPQAIGLKIGQFVNISPLGSMYFARILNLFASVALVYLAIRIIPFGKIILLVIGLLPMTIQQFASMGYDSLHIASVFLFIAFIIKLASQKEKKLSIRDIVILFVIALVSFNVKVGYATLSFLVFILPMAKFKNRKQYWLFTIGFVLVNMFVFLGVKSYFAEDSSGGSVQVESAIDASRQTAYVIANPLNFVAVLFNQVYDKFNFYAETFLFKSGWLKKSMPQFWYVFLVLGMILLVRNEKESVELTKKQRSIFLLVFLMNFTLAFLGLYLVWTKVGATKIAGVQGRYFLGIFPLLLLFFYKANFTFDFEFIKKHSRKFLVIFYLVVFFFVFQHIYEIYYDKTPKETKLEIIK